MKFTTVWAIFSCVSVAWASNIIVANDDTFDEIVLDSDKTSFVKFYADWCSHCVKMQPDWERLADSYANNDKVQIVEIDAHKNKFIGKRYAIKSFPTIKLFRADALSDPVEYSGNREYEYFSNFLMNQVGVKGKKVGPPSKVAQLHDGNIEKMIENKERYAIVAFTTEKNCDDCIAVRKAFDTLSHAFHKELDKIVIAEVQKNGDEPTDWIRNMYDINEYPQIVFISKGDIQKHEIYDGSKEVSDLIKYVNKKIGSRRAANGLLDVQAGIIPQMEDALKRFISSNVVDRREYVKDFIAELKKVDDSEFKEEVKYYALIVNQFIAGHTDYVDNEIEKYEKTIENKAVVAETKDLVSMKINLLNHIKELITPETYKEAADVLKEREEAEKEAVKKTMSKDEL